MPAPSSGLGPQDPTTKQAPRRYLLWGCAAIAILSLCACLVMGAGSAGLLAYVAGEPQGLRVNYAMPAVVRLGETFELVLTLTNTGRADLFVGDIDLDEALGGSILDGVTVTRTAPPMERDFSLSGIKTFRYNQSLSPGESRQVIFEMMAAAPGEFGGSVGVFVGVRAARIDYLGITILP